MLAPICLFTYNRLAETKQTVVALQKNYLASESELIIFSDGGKEEASWVKVNTVRAYLKTIIGFKSIEIIESPVNKGLANSIIGGVSEVLESYGKVIVLEDDLITSRNFLNYMNECLDFYESSQKILSISAHSNIDIIPKNYEFDIAFGYRASSWGWGTWKNRWNKIDWNVSTYNSFKFNIIQRLGFNKGGSDLCNMLDKQMKGKINSWAIRFVYHQYINEMFDVFPIVSKIENIGYGADAENCDIKLNDDIIDSTNKIEFRLPNNIFIDKKIQNSFRKNFGYKVRAIRTLKRIKTKYKKHG